MKQIEEDHLPMDSTKMDMSVLISETIMLHTKPQCITIVQSQASVGYHKG